MNTRPWIIYLISFTYTLLLYIINNDPSHRLIGPILGLHQLIKSLQLLAPLLDINNKTIQQIGDRDHHNGPHNIYHHINTPITLSLGKSVHSFGGVDAAEETYGHYLGKDHEDVVQGVIKGTGERDKEDESALECGPCD